jgi:hypothetical protein
MVDGYFSSQFAWKGAILSERTIIKSGKTTIFFR